VMVAVAVAFRASVPVYQSTQYHPARRQIFGHGHEDLRSHIITAISFSTEYFIKYYNCITYTYHMFT